MKDMKINLLRLYFGKCVADPSILSFQLVYKMATIIRGSRPESSSSTGTESSSVGPPQAQKCLLGLKLNV